MANTDSDTAHQPVSQPNSQPASQPTKETTSINVLFCPPALTNSLTVKSALNYEVFATRNTNLSVTCSDGFCTSSVAYLYVRVTEVNEPITLYPQDFTLSTYEGTVSRVCLCV